MKKYNTHWRPYWLQCKICKLKFDIFAKFETLADDMKTIIGDTYRLWSQTYKEMFSIRCCQSGKRWFSITLDEQVFSFSRYLKLVIFELCFYVRKDANSNRTAEYFKLLGKERVQRLFRIYQIDFEMFDYNHEIYVFSWSNVIKIPSCWELQQRVLKFTVLVHF